MDKDRRQTIGNGSQAEGMGHNQGPVAGEKWGQERVKKSIREIFG